ncbi:MAG TPA: hypothetical protein VFI02_17530, partial [Armatimonadota bacterium]|nr:hypothetical protein [Armatimonadota bacterium]
EPTAAPPKIPSWPPVEYKGVERSPEWLEAAYQLNRSRIAMLDDETAVHLDAPMPNPYLTKPRVGKVIKSGDGCFTVCEDADGTKFTGRFTKYYDSTFRKPAPGMPILIKGRSTILPCQPVPITRLQFAAALQAGLQLSWKGLCEICYGTGERRSRTQLYPYRCPACNGTGKVDVSMEP